MDLGHSISMEPRGGPLPVFPLESLEPQSQRLPASLAYPAPQFLGMLGLLSAPCPVLSSLLSYHLPVGGLQERGDTRKGKHRPSLRARPPPGQALPSAALCCQTQGPALSLFLTHWEIPSLERRSPDTPCPPQHCNGVDWRQKLDSQRGAVIATELKNNSYKLARWTCCALLAGSEYLKLG